MTLIIRQILALFMLPAIPLAVTSPSAAGGCSTTVNLRNASQECVSPASGAPLSPSPSSGPAYVLAPTCAIRVNGLCAEPLRCTTDAGTPGVLHDVTVDGEPAGRWCIGDEEAEAAAVLTPGRVLRAMRRLDWPAPVLTIQPPDGRTLVNLDTNFFTTSAAPVTRRVRLLGRPVTIEATPSTYTWDFGDGPGRTTADPGAPYPDLGVTHRYLRTGTYRPRLATTYAGRFRVGSGPWQQIPGTVTVTGDPQRIEVLEATPRLLGH